MSRKVIKYIVSGVAACVGIFGVSAACTISPTAGWQYAYANNGCVVPDGIATIKRVIDTGDYLQAFMKEQSSTMGFTSTPTSYQQAAWNKDFTGIVHALRFDQNKNSTSKLASSLQGMLQTMWSQYKNSSSSAEQRARLGYLYYLTQAAVKALNERLNGVGTHYDGSYYDNKNNSNNDYAHSEYYGEGLQQIRSYTTLNNRNYTIRREGYYYMFSRDNSSSVHQAMRARNLQDLINYLEHQNRLILVAPNRRNYGVRKYNEGFKINRDNGSVLDKLFVSFEAAKQLLDTCATNTPVPAQYHAMCGFSTYGR